MARITIISNQGLNGIIKSFTCSYQEIFIFYSLITIIDEEPGINFISLHVCYFL